MGKLDYLEALKRAMLGLPPDVQARTLAYYEQRFVDAEIVGRSEQDVARELDDPKKIAMTLRASAHLNAFTEKKHPANFLRLAVSAVGLAIFNLFMIVPAMVYSALLVALYACALAFYLGGVVTTASGLAGTNELVLDWPVGIVTVEPGQPGVRQTRIEIGDSGIQVHQDRSTPPPDLPGARRDESRLRRGAEAVADNTIRITTGMDADSRTTQALLGLGLVIGGIVLFLVSLVVTRYSLIGLKRYFQMNRSLLKGS